MRNQNRNLFKYIFILVVIGLIAGSIYLLYYNNKEDDLGDENNTSYTESKISIVDNLKMEVSGYDTLNPIISKNKEIQNIDKLIFDPLVSISADYKLENCLAKQINKVSDLKYEIKIDTSVKWQNGSDFIAKDVEFTINKIKENDSIYRINVENIASTEIVDNETILINLNSPDLFFEYKLDFPIMSYMHYVNEDFINSTKIPIGTGMYKVASNDQNNIFLVINERWRKISKSKPKTQSITIKKVSAVGESFNSFKMGSVDIINTSMFNYTDYVGTMGYNKKEYPGRNFDFISFNCEDTILREKAVRQAIAYAINKGSIISSVFRDNKVVSHTPLDYGCYLNTFENIPNYNVEKSKSILTEAGWVYTNSRWQKNINGNVKRLTLTVIVRNDSIDRINVCNALRNQLEEVGIELNISKVSVEKYNEYINNKNYQIMLTGITNSISPNLDYFYGSYNLANYRNGDILSKINSIDNYTEILKIANDDVPYIGLYRNKEILLLNANVGGNFKPNNYFTYYNFNEWFRQQ